MLKCTDKHFYAILATCGLRAWYRKGISALVGQTNQLSTYCSYTFLWHESKIMRILCQVSGEELRIEAGCSALCKGITLVLGMRRKYFGSDYDV
jgi:hypothetical protein